MCIFAVVGKWDYILAVIAKLGNITLGELAKLNQVN